MKQCYIKNRTFTFTFTTRVDDENTVVERRALYLKKAVQKNRKPVGHHLLDDRLSSAQQQFRVIATFDRLLNELRQQRLQNAAKHRQLEKSSTETAGGQKNSGARS